MQVLGRVVPYFYALILFIVLVGGSVDALFIHEASKAFTNWTASLANIYFWVGIGIASLYAVFTAVQLAVLDLHSDKDRQFEEETKRLGRLAIVCFLLALPCVAAYAVNARFVAQTYNHDGFFSEGSMIYFISALFMLMAAVSWPESRRHGLI